MFTYLTNCVNSNDGPGVREMIDGARQVTWKTFIRHVPVKEIKELFPFYAWRGRGLHIKSDYAVAFYKSKYRGQKCYYIEHSRIEYIWTLDKE